MMKLGSLFDGSGGFPLGGIIAGLTPVWSSEIEPFPIRVTEKRLPSVRHYGDVSKLNGADLEPVDVITFGSPCQDMSVAGKRAGLDGARSGLFFQAVRIIKEMRAKYQKPRFIVWENVRGALSSAGGDDFRRVLEEICNVKKSDVSVPKPEKWNGSGLIMGDDFSVAWRVLDAQYWGVPQRRKRIYLVTDFDGDSAGKILFESEGVSGHSEKMQAARKDFARCAQGSAGETVGVLNDQGGSSISIEDNLSPTLRAETHQHLPIVYGLGSYNSEGMKSSNPYSGIYRADTARTLDINADWRVRMITPLECARLQGFPDWWTDGLTDSEPSDAEVRKWQGIFDEYCDINGKKRKTASQVRKWLMTEPTDAAKYKMWGNGVALPCVVFVLAGIVWAAGEDL